jgi:hypothetical protein
MRLRGIPNVAVLKESSSLFECEPFGSPEKLVDETLVRQSIIGGHINDLIAMSASLPAPLDLPIIMAKAFASMGSTAAGRFAELMFASKASPWLKDIVRFRLGALLGDNESNLSNYAHFLKAIDLVSGSKAAANSVAVNKALLTESNATTTSAVWMQVVRGIADRLGDLYQPQFQVPGQPRTTRQELALSSEVGFCILSP